MKQIKNLFLKKQNFFSIKLKNKKIIAEITIAKPDKKEPVTKNKGIKHKRYL